MTLEKKPPRKVGLLSIGLLTTLAVLATSVRYISNLKWVQLRSILVSDNKNVQFILQDSQNDNTWEREQLERKKLIRKVCKQYPRLNKIVSVGRMFITDAKQKLAYCRHGKVGTTTWLAHFISLSNMKESTLSKLIGSSDPISGHAFSKLIGSSEPIKEGHAVDLLHKVAKKGLAVKSQGVKLKNFIRSTISFSMVRHPFVRLVSAYEDKIVQRKQFKKIIRNFGGVNFTSFVKYVLFAISRGGNVDVHWRPYVSRCNYCNVNYTVIAKIETFGEDLAHISSLSGLQFKSSRRGNEGGDTGALTTRLFSQLPRNLGEKLYRAYKKDFLMFDYDPWMYLNLTVPMYNVSRTK